MAKRKHILVISQYFYPEPFRINDMCAEWIKRGYKVTVVTGIPNYPQGKYYEGYSLTNNRTEEWNDVKIVRIPLIARGNNAIGLVCNYMSFVLSGYIWKCLSKIKADYVFTFEVSPMTQALIGVWYAKKHKVPHYLYVQDLWPENVEIVTGIHSPVILKPIGKMVDYIYKNCDHIFATSPSFVKEIQKRCEKKDKVTYWPQYAEEFYKPIEKKTIPEIPDDGKFKIIFTGNIGQAQGLEILPKVAKFVEDVEFVIVGDGRNKENFLAEIKKMQVEDKFIMIDCQPAEKIPEFLACCDAAFVSFMDNELFTKTIPAKLQSYLACGMPIIASASGETKRVVEEAECGLCSQIGDVAGLRKIIEDIQTMDLEEMRKNSIDYCSNNFEKKKLMNDIEQYFV